MLAFEVTVSLSTEEGKGTVARWMANPSFLNTVEHRMWNGDIELVKYNGGYPDIYRAYGPMVVQWLREREAELELHPVGQININEVELARVGRQWLRMTLWDQS